MPKKSRSKKKTDQKPGYEIQKVERLLLYAIGKSNIPLSAYDIEKEVVKQIPGPDQQKHIYTVLKRLVPHHQQGIPYLPLLQLDDFFDKDFLVKEIGNDEEKDKLTQKIIRNVFKSYPFLLGGEEEDWECNFSVKEQEQFVIRIKHRKEQNTALRFVFQNKEGSNQPSTTLFYKNFEIPLCKVRSNGKPKIFSAKHFPYLHLKHYLDEAPKYSSDVEFDNESVSGFEVYQISSKDSPGEDSQFILNLRGLLHYLLLNKQRNKIQSDQMNEVIETLAMVDKYHDLEDEFKAMDPVRPGFTTGNKIVLEKKTSNYKVKERFPFLSYYNEYKECLPINFAVDTLYEIAIDLLNNLEKMNIFDLKYEVTQKFLEKMEGVIWESPDGFSEPAILSLNPTLNTIRSAYRNYQHEIRTYLRMRKEKEIKIQVKREHRIKEELEIVEFKQKVFENMKNIDKDFILISEAIHSNNDDMVNHCLNGTQINIIKDICKFHIHKYHFGWKYLFKESFIEEIEKLLLPEMDYGVVKKILMEKGIHEEGILTAVLELTKYTVNFDKEMQPYQIVKKYIPEL